MSKIKAASATIVMCLAMTSAWAKDAEGLVRPHGLERTSEEALIIPQHLWNIIGTYTALRPESEKFIKPANDCTMSDSKELDYLLQLEMCKEARKGWLKI